MAAGDELNQRLKTKWNIYDQNLQYNGILRNEHNIKVKGNTHYIHFSPATHTVSSGHILEKLEGDDLFDFSQQWVTKCTALTKGFTAWS